MRKKIIKYISVIILLSTIGLLAIFGKIIKEHEVKVEINTMNTMITQVVETMKLNQKKLEQARKLFIDDYLNRLKFATFLIGDDSQRVITQKEWQEMLDVLEVDNIYIVDNDGIIIQSSNQDSVGVDFYTDDRLKKFIPLIEGKEKEGHYSQLEAISVSANQPMIYIGIERPGETGGMIQIEIDPELLRNYERMSSIETFISSIPMEERQILFVVNKDTGEIQGSTKNNGEDLDLKASLKILNDLIDKPSIKIINGISYLVVVKEYNGSLICYLSEESSICKNVNNNIVNIAIFMMILSILIIIALYFIVDRLILKDIEDIYEKANLFVGGKLDISFRQGKTKEISDLSMKLNKVIQVIQIKRERISTIASLMGKEFGAYEYYADLHQVFYSTNLPDLLGMTEEECEDSIKEHFATLQNKAILTKESLKEEEIITTNNGKVLKIRRTTFENASYAFLEDITKEKHESEELFKSLEEEKEKSYIDELTGLYNRKKIKECIDAPNGKNKPTHGAMILMDLDNFKKVNDQEGHIEGDILLKKFANLIKKQFRDSDIKVRLGGDEFMVFIPNYIREDILNNKIESFLDEVRTELEYYYKEYKLSVSVGITCFADDSHSFEELYQCADAAMYMAKHQGKDGFYINKERDVYIKEKCKYCNATCLKRLNKLR